MKLAKGLGLIAPAALFAAGMAMAQNYPDPRIKSGEPQIGQVNGTTLAPNAPTSYTPVTEDMLRHPDPNDWLMMRGNYEGYGFSKLDQINKANVGHLQLVWARGMEPGINEATPIVYKGVMYLGNPNDVIQAIDAATGEILWQYRRTLPSLAQFHNNP